tara:strand:- start:3348 stop:3599 length:252 start_codon:yes stop_codon:yes gene_type:complete
MDKFLLNCVLWSVILNVVLSMLATHVATPEEVTPPKGAANLSLKGQIMHMLVHHNQVLVTSSLIVAIVVGLSVYSAKEYALLK